MDRFVHLALGWPQWVAQTAAQYVSQFLGRVWCASAYRLIWRTKLKDAVFLHNPSVIQRWKMDRLGNEPIMYLYVNTRLSNKKRPKQLFLHTKLPVFAASLFSEVIDDARPPSLSCPQWFSKNRCQYFLYIITTRNGGLVTLWTTYFPLTRKENQIVSFETLLNPSCFG